jgi:hypothetical protein
MPGAPRVPTRHSMRWLPAPDGRLAFGHVCVTCVSSCRVARVRDVCVSYCACRCVQAARRSTKGRRITSPSSCSSVRGASRCWAGAGTAISSARARASSTATNAGMMSDSEWAGHAAEARRGGAYQIARGATAARVRRSWRLAPPSATTRGDHDLYSTVTWYGCSGPVAFRRRPPRAPPDTQRAGPRNAGLQKSRVAARPPPVCTPTRGVKALGPLARQL